MHNLSEVHFSNWSYSLRNKFNDWLFQVFRNIAYHADNSKDLLAAINEFLDVSLVLPPGKWDSKTLLPIIHMARKKTQKKEYQQLSTIEDLRGELFV